MIEKFTFDLHLLKIHKKMILVKKETELRTHVILKLLAYILFYHPKLQIEVEAGMHYKPDLVQLDEDGQPEVWIDCGHVAVVKVQNLTRKLRRTRLVFVKETQSELQQFKRLIEKKVEGFERIECLGFENGVVAAMAEALQRKNDLTYYKVTENVIGIALNDEIFESTLCR